MGSPRRPIRSLDKADRLVLERLLADAGVTASVAAA
jgi:hypothetical protein